MAETVKLETFDKDGKKKSVTVAKRDTKEGSLISRANERYLEEVSKPSSIFHMAGEFNKITGKAEKDLEEALQKRLKKMYPKMEK